MQAAAAIAGDKYATHHTFKLTVTKPGPRHEAAQSRSLIVCAGITRVLAAELLLCLLFPVMVSHASIR